MLLLADVTSAAWQLDNASGIQIGAPPGEIADRMRPVRAHHTFRDEQPMKILNIGCGLKTSSSTNVINIDWSIYLRIKRNPLLYHIMKLFLNAERRQALDALPDNVMVHDLRKGLPFVDNSVDAVYHSQFLEHLDRPIAAILAQEVKRVLKPGGIHRIVVPDLEKLCRGYLTHLQECDQNAELWEQHDARIADMIEQMVRREALGTSLQKPLRRAIEKLVLGDARRRGETHQWMYDRINLSALLRRVGYKQVDIFTFDTSNIPNWNDYGLDQKTGGQEYEPSSLYIEAIK
jgi:SAM-dependent methyltransferase